MKKLVRNVLESIVKSLSGFNSGEFVAFQDLRRVNAEGNQTRIHLTMSILAKLDFLFLTNDGIILKGQYDELEYWLEGTEIDMNRGFDIGG